MRMHTPPHPGKVFRSACLADPDGNEIITITDAAKAMNITRAALSEFVNGRRGVSPKLAIKIAKAFGGAAEHWLRMQAAYDLWQQEQTYTPDDVTVIYERT